MSDALDFGRMGAEKAGNSFECPRHLSFCLQCYAQLSPGIGMQCCAHCQPYLRPGMEPCHISFGSSLDGEGAAIPLLLDQLVPSFARYDLQVPITGPRFFPAGFEEMWGACTTLIAR